MSHDDEIRLVAQMATEIYARWANQNVMTRQMAVNHALDMLRRIELELRESSEPKAA